MEPDFKALAQAWLANDPRVLELRRTDPQRADALVDRMAEAMRQRRQGVAEPGPAVVEERGDLVINVHPSRFVEGKGLDTEALEQIARYIEEVAQEDEES